MSKPTVAILGASANPAKYGNISIRAHLRLGYEVYPVHPHESQIEGLRVYSRLGEIPIQRIDRISVYLPPATLLPLLDQIASMDHQQLFLNPGTESAEVLQRAKELGLDPIQACSIVDLGITPADV